MDGEGRPVAGATLSLLEVERTFMIEYGPGRATTDAAGRFRLPHLPPRPFDLLASASGFGPLRVPGLVPPASRNPGGAVLDLGDVVLPPCVAIEGRVTDRRGSPLAEANVGLAETIRNAEPSPGSQVTTGPDGRFRLADLRQGERYDLWVQHQGHVSAHVPGVEAPTDEPLRVELRPARVLAGRVVGPAGEPVPYASLLDFEENGAGQGDGLSSYGSQASTLTRTDAQGRFRADGVEPGTLNLEVKAPEYKTRRLRGLVIPEESDVENLEIVLERGATVTGRVLDARGEPVAGADVSATPMEAGRGIGREDHSASSETDGEGRYRLGGLDPGSHRITANRYAEGQHTETEILVRPGENVVNLAFRRITEVSGRVVDESGEPISNASVSLGGAHDAKGVRSGPGGLFHFPAVEDGDYQLSGGGSGFIGPVEPVAVEVDGRPVRDLELRLRRGGTLLTGRLLGLAPGELERVTVAAQAEGTPWPRPGTVSRDGTYRLPDLEPGTWEVTAALSSGRRARASIRLEPGQERAVLDLEITSGLALAGRVLADGAPLPGVRILLSRQRGRGAETTTVHDGRFRLEGLEPGAYVLLATHSATGLGTAQAVDLSQDRDLLVEIASGAVRGQVELPPGEPAAGLDIFLEGTDPALGVSFLGPSVQTDAQGSFELPRVAAGRYRLTVRRRGSPLATAEVRVAPGEAATVRVEPGAGGVH
ncbi:MAG TPA: carboxypeptidase-like regulatory domain-containing protein [Thermoanaerobaculia bacterium]|nr:carboxypeptidase-like regulatory domain-containing protein [Thermoanaerobaculia bacterium]